MKKTSTLTEELHFPGTVWEENVLGKQQVELREDLSEHRLEAISAGEAVVVLAPVLFHLDPVELDDRAVLLVPVHCPLYYLAEESLLRARGDH